ncbi:MAG: 3-dehydroquinate synthase [Acidobacteria bacterium]|nr:3-dehydroquinate synthase [Acidobacteriota bacterium]
MQRIEVAGERGSYDVVVGRGLLGRLPALIEEGGVEGRAAPVTNTTVGPLHARSAAAAAGWGQPLELQDGEEFKRWESAEHICRWLLAGDYGRRDPLVAIGGGVVTDVVGFAAAVYLRGIEWVAVPTTLLAMVDAAVGGKTGVNLEEGKNLLGAFWPPRLVVADVDALVTLPERELRAGLAEVVKGAWIGDHGLLELLPNHTTGFGDLSPQAWQELVVRAVRIKTKVVTADERETGSRQALNLGHTLGHALESVTSYQRFLHGEAVAWGMRAAAAIANRRGLLSDRSCARLEEAVHALGPVPPLADLDPEELLAHIGRDKKRDRGGVAWVLPTDEGVVLGQRVEPVEVREVLRQLIGERRSEVGW